MIIPFYKYQGTGNDFIMIDNRQNTFAKNDTILITSLCDRRFGIGADGLILIEEHPDADFNMIYYNADGSSSMCGNGGRCVVAFAKKLGIIEDSATFEAIDGRHEATLKEGIVSLKMGDVNKVDVHDNHIFVNTGSPHHIEFVEDLDALDVKAAGSKIRHGPLYGKQGSNINFVKQIADGFRVRTYERGVEDETLSCGTGVTAVALAMVHLGKTSANPIKLYVKGGELEVSYTKKETGFTDIHLIGPANFVFQGTWGQ